MKRSQRDNGGAGGVQGVVGLGPVGGVQEFGAANSVLGASEEERDVPMSDSQLDTLTAMHDIMFKRLNA
jgi:hypothetical protein